MSKKLTAFFLFSALSVISIQTPAAPTTCNEVQCTGNLEFIYTHGTIGEDGRVFITLPGDISRLHCNFFQDRLIVLDRTNKMFDQIYSTMLTAIASNSRIRVRVHTNGNPVADPSIEKSECRVAYVILYAD